MSHGDEALELPEGFRLTARTANALAGIANEERRMWAVQFHPEVAHTRQGTELLKNFVVDICGATADWTPGHFIQTTVERVRAQVGDGHAICGLSGGRGLKRGGGAGEPSDRGSADLHFCEQRGAAQGRV